MPDAKEQLWRVFPGLAKALVQPQYHSTSSGQPCFPYISYVLFPEPVAKNNKRCSACKGHSLFPEEPNSQHSPGWIFFPNAKQFHMSCNVIIKHGGYKPVSPDTSLWIHKLYLVKALTFPYSTFLVKTANPLNVQGSGITWVKEQGLAISLLTPLARLLCAPQHMMACLCYKRSVGTKATITQHSENCSC